MDLENLKYFIVVAQLQHMSHAAEELNISQPALSMCIRKLESELGVSLFDRVGKSISLNSAGKVFLRDSQEIIRMFEDSRRRLRVLGGTRTTIKLNSSSMASFPKLMSTIYSSSNGLFIEKVDVPISRLADSIESGEVDLSVIGSKVTDSRLNCKLLTDDELVMLVPGSHRFASRRSAELLEFAGDNFVYSGKAGTFKSELALFSAKAGFAPKLVYQCFSIADLVDAVKHGNLVALAPLRALAAYDTGDAVAISISEPVCTSHLYMYWSRNAPDSSPLSAVRDSVIQYFKSSIPVVVDGKARMRFDAVT